MAGAFFFDSDAGDRPAGAHVIVCGNEKGGSGKSTMAVHIAVALMKAGRTVAAIDLDSRQLTMTRHLENRSRWSRQRDGKIAIPTHARVLGSRAATVAEREAAEFERLSAAIDQLGSSHDFIVVDTPGADSYLTRLAHMLADTLVTPMNDSFVDMDVLARVDPVNWEIVDLSAYATAVRDARRKRRAVDGGVIDWIVVRNRMATIGSRNEARVHACLTDLSMRLGFRIADGIGERVIFREYFPCGLTALDDIDASVFGIRPTVSHLAARTEILRLVDALRLPLDAAARARARSRKHAPAVPA